MIAGGVGGIPLQKPLASGSLDGICEICGRDCDFLLLHHVSYIPEIIQYICKSCHWKQHASEHGCNNIGKPYNCPMRSDEDFSVISFTCFKNCSLNGRYKNGRCEYHFSVKFPLCNHPGSITALKKMEKGKCGWENRACRGKIIKCKYCGHIYCENHFCHHGGDSE